MLGKDTIMVPRRYSAFLDVDDSECRFIAFSDLENPPIVGEAMPYPVGMALVPALEESVYANPLLLSDFDSITVMFHARRFMLIPDFVTDDSLAGKLFREQYPIDNDLPPSQLLIDDWKGLGARLVYEVESDEFAFLQRTFNNPSSRHPLSVQALYFAARRSGHSGTRTLLSVSDDRADIIVLGRGGVLCANSFAISGPMDAAYYALAVRQTLELPPRDELMLAGTASIRASLTPVLRRAVSFVIPAIEPPAVLSAPKEVRALPFALKIAPFANI